MTWSIRLGLVAAFFVSATIGSPEVSSCTNEEDSDIVHEVSLLQTELHMSKGILHPHGGSQYPNAQPRPQAQSQPLQAEPLPQQPNIKNEEVIKDSPYLFPDDASQQPVIKIKEFKPIIILPPEQPLQPQPLAPQEPPPLPLQPQATQPPQAQPQAQPRAQPEAQPQAQPQAQPKSQPEPQQPQAKPQASSDSSKGAITLQTGLIWSGIAVLFLVVATFIAYFARDSEGQAAGWPKYVAEFVGTFMLVFSVGCNVLVGDKTWGVVAIACTLMVSIYALGGISGANFNPAVSVSLGFAKKMEWLEVVIYICVQFSAGIFAALFYGLYLEKTFDLGPKGGHGWLEAGLAEFFYTFMLTFVVLNTACSKKHAGKNQFYGLAIGFSVVAGGYGAGAISGGCFNPAVALAVDASSFSSGFGWCFAYMAFEFVGCAFAAAFFSICRPEDFDDKYQNALVSKIVSEFLGTFMLVLTVGLNVLNHSKAGVFSIAASLMCMIFALGSVSGAHFNPAVTLAVFCSGRNQISMKDAACYMLVQFFAGVCAAYTYMLMMYTNTVPLTPANGASKALTGELMFTFLLCFVVLCVATVQQPLSEYFGLAIGACVIAGGYAIGSLSGGSLNPAVSAGLAFSDAYNGGPVVYFFSYAAVEFLAGLIAAAVFATTHIGEYTEKLIPVDRSSTAEPVVEKEA